MYKVRGMKLREFNTVVHLIYESVHFLCVNEYSKEELDAWVPPNLDMPSFRSSLSRCYAIVALNDKKEIVGFMSTERDGYVNRLYTRHDYAKRGVATALLENTEAWAKKHSLNALSLEASKSAEGFYLKKGFVKTGELNSVKNGIKFTSAKMRKELKRNGETG
jgi:putative acetyltransferase